MTRLNGAQQAIAHGIPARATTAVACAVVEAIKVPRRKRAACIRQAAVQKVRNEMPVRAACPLRRGKSRCSTLSTAFDEKDALRLLPSENNGNSDPAMRLTMAKRSTTSSRDETCCTRKLSELSLEVRKRH